MDDGRDRGVGLLIQWVGRVDNRRVGFLDPGHGLAPKRTVRVLGVHEAGEVGGNAEGEIFSGISGALLLFGR